MLMAELVLNRLDVHAGTPQLGSEGTPQPVRVHTFQDAR
jgi:hypothetical protein